MNTNPSMRWPVVAAMAALVAAAAPVAQSANLWPTTLFAQVGAGEEQTREYLVGATWNTPWHYDYGHLNLSAYVETGLGRWVVTRDGKQSAAWLTQLSATPVLRARPLGAASRWFGEIGVGANFILPVYQSGPKRFSTKFNFGDHLAVGRNFGRDGRHELSLRLEHFSNAGIQEPNPGENFVQLRYSWSLPDAESSR